MASLSTPTVDGTNCCRNPFCGAPLRNGHMHFCENKRHCQLLRCLVLSGRSLSTNSSKSTASSPAHAAAAADTFVIPKRKLQPVTPMASAQTTEKKPAASKKRPLPGSASNDKDVSVALKWPRVANQTAPATKPALTKAKAKKELLKQVASSDNPGKYRAVFQPTPKPPPEPELYDVSGFHGAQGLDPKYFRDLFSLYRSRKGKTMVASKASLANSWAWFMKAWNKDRLECAFGPVALRKSSEMVHKRCEDRQLPFCYAHLISPGKCPGCGPAAPPYSLSQFSGASSKTFEASVFQNHLALDCAVIRRNALKELELRQFALSIGHQDKRLYQLRCLVLAAQSLPTKSHAATQSQLADPSSNALSTDALVIPKRKARSASPETPVPSTESTSETLNSASKKRHQYRMIRTRPSCRSGCVLSSRRFRLGKQQGQNQGQGHVSEYAAASDGNCIKWERSQSALCSPRAQPAASRLKQNAQDPDRSPTTLEIYNLSGFQKMQELSLPYFKELFAIYRRRKGKTLETAEASLTKS